ncbi:MAG TPA: copper resistance protein CopC [Ilumatobacteraceae bacterium]|nr:copper resistance protein CopC [Ilumatobacteraceae bacterium]
MIVQQLAVRRRLVALAAVVGAIVTLGVASGTALAHAELTSSNPANQAILAVQPSEIVLTFSEEIDTVDDSIRLVDADGNPAPLGAIDQSLGKNTLRAPVALIPDGTYIVGWQAISADSHKIRGAFTFSVGAATPTAPGVIDEIFDAGETAQSDSLLLGVGRFMSYAGIGVLLGALFLAAMLVPELIGERRIGTLLVAAALTAAVGTAVMFLAQAHLISGSYFTWGEVVKIQSGQWWLARLAAIGLFALFIPARSFLASTPGRVEVALASLLVCGVVAAGGHAVAGDIVVAGFVATVFHVAAMSIWLGGLALLAFGVQRSWFWWTASQFSPWALGAVVALALTGSVNAWRQLGSLSGLTDSSYGRWLVVKLLLVVLVVAVAFFSRRLAHSDDDDTPRLDEPVDDLEPTVASPPQDAPVALRRTVLFEIAGIALILMATAGLVNSPPPPSAATTESASAVVGDRIVQVELEPAVTGGTEMHVYLSSPSGGLDRPEEITVTASLPSANLGPLDIETVPAGPNHVIATDVNLPVAGMWTFDVTARFGEFDQVVFTVEIPVSD